MNSRRIPVWLCLSTALVALLPAAFGNVALAAERNAALAAERIVARLSPAEIKRRSARDRYNFIASMGGIYHNVSVRRYVMEIGHRLAEAATVFGDYFEGVPEFKYQILNEASAGAFVLGNAEVFVTRGLLAIANTEDEVAAVVAHEIAHVLGGHNNRRSEAAVGARTESGMRFNSEQEFEADVMSVRMLVDAGYNPFAQARMLAAVSNDMAFSILMGRTAKLSEDEKSELQAGIDERIARARDAASVLPVVADLRARRATHLAAIDGMDYGQPPSRGIVHGQTFFDARWHYSFTLPDRFRFERTTGPMRAVGPGGASLRLDRARTRRHRIDIARYLVQVASRGRKLQNIIRMSVDGMDAAMGVTSLTMKDGKADLRVVAIHASPRTIYRFQYMMPEGISAAQKDKLWRTTYTFKLLSRQEAAALKPYRLGLLTVETGDTIDSLTERMAFLDHPRLRFLVLNGLRADDRLVPGDTVKIVIE